MTTNRETADLAGFCRAQGISPGKIKYYTGWLDQFFQFYQGGTDNVSNEALIAFPVPGGFGNRIRGFQKHDPGKTTHPHPCGAVQRGDQGIVQPCFRHSCADTETDIRRRHAFTPSGIPLPRTCFRTDMISAPCRIC